MQKHSGEPMSFQIWTFTLSFELISKFTSWFVCINYKAVPSATELLHMKKPPGVHTLTGFCVVAPGVALLTATHVRSHEIAANPFQADGLLRRTLVNICEDSYVTSHAHRPHTGHRTAHVYL